MLLSQAPRQPCLRLFRVLVSVLRPPSRVYNVWHAPTGQEKSSPGLWVEEAGRRSQKGSIVGVGLGSRLGERGIGCGVESCAA